VLLLAVLRCLWAWCWTQAASTQSQVDRWGRHDSVHRTLRAGWTGNYVKTVRMLGGWGLDTTSFYAESGGQVGAML
jgi:hypothetical protein